MAIDDGDQMKDRIKWMWSLGDYAELAALLQPAAHALVAACDISPGMEVLDVAAGTGNFALAAAERGARVMASDLTPKMVEMGRERSNAAALAVEWTEADADRLPFESDRFDVVASVFGAMFANPERVTTELFRVAKVGASVAMANYANEGFLGRLGELVASYAPSGSTTEPSPFLWGDPLEVRERFGALASSIHTERHALTFAFSSPDEAWRALERANPVIVALSSVFPEATYQELRERVMEMMDELNAADDGRLTLESDYLLVVARKAATRALHQD
jgi:SAM-dependent methyltransferase